MITINAQCQCGANQIEFSSLPITRFICHCLVCQKYTGKPYSDVCVFIHNQIKTMQIKDTQFKRYKLPPNIRRGICQYCQQPSIEFGLFNQLVIIATSNLQQQECLPPAQMHIFYHRHLHKFDDHLPKYNGFIYSQVMTSKLLLQQTVKHLCST